MPAKHTTIRLPAALDQSVTEYLRDHGLTRTQALLSLVKQGLEACGTNQPTQRDTLADLAARVEALEANVTVLQRGTSVAQKGSKPLLDQDKHYLGPLCQRLHDWEGSGQSRYSKRNQSCMACEAERARERRAAKKR